MDIVKQLRFIFFFLGGLLLAFPVLDHFGISPEEVYYVVFPSKKPNAKDAGYSTTTEVDQVFEITTKDMSIPHTSMPAVRTTDLNTQEVENAAIAHEEDKKALGTVVTGLEQSARPLGKDTKTKSKWIAPPIGFNTFSSYNFLIYREFKAVTEQISKVLEGIHGNLMLDLVPFTLVKTPNKSLVVLFSKQSSYSDFTKRPSWSGAACDVPRETLYVLETAGFYPLSIHEMTHLYFDGFFSPKKMPLWISEGMATYMQVKASGETPIWITNALKRIKAGQSIDMDVFTEVKTLSGMPNDFVELWYTQAYSITDYLLNTRTRDEFYNFCLGIGEGEEQTTSLYRAYGLPFTKFSTLGSVWLHDGLNTQNAVSPGGVNKKAGASKAISAATVLGNSVSNKTAIAVQNTQAVPPSRPTGRPSVSTPISSTQNNAVQASGSTQSYSRPTSGRPRKDTQGGV